MQTNKEDLAQLVTAESGKSLVEARGDVSYGNSFVEFYSEEAIRIHGEIFQSSMNNKKLMVIKQPIGVVALITPWNFPHAMIARKAGAALAAGCTIVIKPAEDTPLTALAMAELANDAGFPNGVVNVVTCSRENTNSVGSFLCTSPSVAGISFTGLTAVGKLLYQLCAPGLKRIAMELGGNAPFIVFDSANIGKAVEGAMIAKFRNCGQTCIAANRFLIQENVYNCFLECFINRIRDIKLEDGAKPEITNGPLINAAQMDKVSRIVQDALEKGACALIGGNPACSIGNLFYEPTVLVGVKEHMKIFNEEIFGPVAAVTCFKTEEECIRIANSAKGGLAAYFYSENIGQVIRVAEALECGMIGINESAISTPEVPFGGVKESGIGREGSHHGIDDFIYIKYLCVGC